MSSISKRPRLTRQNGQKNIFNPTTQGERVFFNKTTKRYNGRHRNHQRYTPKNNNNRNLRNSRLSHTVRAVTRNNQGLNSKLSLLYATISSEANSYNDILKIISKYYNQGLISKEVAGKLLDRADFLYNSNSNNSSKSNSNP